MCTSFTIQSHHFMRSLVGGSQTWTEPVEILARQQFVTYYVQPILQLGSARRWIAYFHRLLLSGEQILEFFCESSLVRADLKSNLRSKIKSPLPQ